MADYLEINIELISQYEPDREIVLALLADFGFEGFRELDGRLLAYIKSEDFIPEKFESMLDPVRNLISSHETTEIPARNWNELWERSYSPVDVSPDCRVRAPFHLPRKGIRYDLVISPKMSFGTAHHNTTRLMMEEMLEGDWSGKKVLDLGCGTGILAVLAAKLGAGQIIAADTDEHACRNTRENISLNKTGPVQVVKGELSSIQETGFHAILANINLNVLLGEMKNLGRKLTGNGILILSGFFHEDLGSITGAAARDGLLLIKERTLNQWTVAVYIKAD